MLERQHLEILRHIAAKGSLTAAAKELCLTQSALSHAMRKLENNSAVSLWHVKGRRIVLTEAGEYLLIVADRLLPEFEKAEEMLTLFSSGKTGMLTIGMECHPCYRWLLTVINPYLQSWPDVELDVRQKFQFNGLEALACREIDILVTPDPVEKADIVFHRIFDYELVVVVSARSALADKSFIEPADMRHETLLAYPVSPVRLDIYTRFLVPAALAPKHHRTVESTDIMMEMVAANRGVTTMPAWLVKEYSSKLPVTSRPLGKQGLFKSLYLGVRQDSTASYLTAFIDLAKSVNS